MPFDRSRTTYPAPPEIAQLADKYKSGFQTHLHYLADLGELISEEHRRGVIAECNEWLQTIAAGRGAPIHSAGEIERIKRWAIGLTS